MPSEFPLLLRFRRAVHLPSSRAACPELTEELLKRRVTAIAYETVTSEGGLPLLRPMSEVAGILSIQVGARGLERSCGGRGVLLPPVWGNAPGNVLVLGAGVAGRAAARVASGFGAKVTVLDMNREKLLLADQECGHRVRTVLSEPGALAEALREADLVVSAVLLAGERAPRMLTREMLRTMRPGAVVVDISIDQGGAFETSRPTTHDSPYYVEEGIVHYCVTNMPAAVPRTSTLALTTATLPYLESMRAAGRDRRAAGGRGAAGGAEHLEREHHLPGRREGVREAVRSAGAGGRLTARGASLARIPPLGDALQADQGDRITEPTDTAYAEKGCPHSLRAAAPRLRPANVPFRMLSRPSSSRIGHRILLPIKRAGSPPVPHFRPYVQGTPFSAYAASWCSAILSP